MSEVSVRSETINVETERWGKLKIDLDEVIDFESGIPGFESVKQFALLKSPDIQPFLWLLSIDEPELGFVLLDPQDIMPDYEPRIYETDLLELNTGSQDKLAMFVIVTLNSNPVNSTVNLQGPILINTTKKTGKQIVVVDEEFSTKHPIMSNDKDIDRSGSARSDRKTVVRSGS